MKLWIDDVRPAPPGWHWVKTSEEALQVLSLVLGRVTHISFDHDLGEDDTTRPVVAWLEELAHDRRCVLPIYTQVHSANPVGRKWLEMGLERVTWLCQSWPEES